MYITEPSYADGIGKGKQTKFGGLNHNEGAGDGELFAMKNLGSDYYPLIATRKKRRKLRTLTKPNGLYAWEKLCWVDGTTFYYDGVAKGTVEDSRKQFAAINDIIIIMPDKKYYDTVEDKFGTLDAEVRVTSGETIEIDTAPTETETIRSEAEIGYIWTNRLPRTVGGWLWRETEITVEDDRITGLSIGGSIPIGEYLYIQNVEDPYNCGAKKLTDYSRTEGWLQFEEGSLKDGTFRGKRPGYIAFYNCEIARAQYSGGAEGYITLVQTGHDGNWTDFFSIGDLVEITAEGETETLKRVKYCGSDLDGILVKGEQTGQKIYTDLVSIAGRTIPAVIFRDGTLDGEETERNTIYCAGIDWAEHLVPGDTVEIIDSSFEVSRLEGGETVTETVSNDGIYIVREVDGHELRFDADSFTNGEDNGTIDYYQGGTGIHFETTRPSATVFGTESLHCRLDGTDWTETLGEGALVKIEDCSIEGNNKTLMVRSVEEQDLGFDEDSFTAGAEADGIKVTRLHQYPIEFRDGTIYGEHAEANTVYCGGVIWSDYFRVGDTITITGSMIPLNNQTLIIRELDGHEMRFYENSFTNGIDSGDTILFRRDMPDLECVFENDNRLWGYTGKAIYASKLGDPFNFNVYDGLDTDSYAVDTGSPGAFTGGWSYMGYPTFFKGRNVYKVYGNKPSNYEVMNVATLGLMSGGGKSLAIAGETLFYLGECGIIMYTGGVPTPINRAFGQERYRNAVAGSDGLKYYVSMEDLQGVWHLFVYDSQKGLWHEEDNTEVVGFAYLDGQLYMLDSEGNFTTEGYVREEEGEEEEDFEWYAEFTDFTDDSPNKKEVHKVQIRIDLEENATCKVKLQMDGDGEWIVPQDGEIEGGSKRSYTLAIVPRRADFYKLRLEGQGGCKIYSIARQYSEGSELKSRPGRQ